VVGGAYVAQLADGSCLLTGAPRPGALGTQAVLAIVFILIAIERAWQIIGGRDSRLLSVITESPRTEPATLRIWNGRTARNSPRSVRNDQEHQPTQRRAGRPL
jgi:hypothetical protein